MAGMFLPLAGFSEKAINAVPTRGGKLVFDASDFAQDKIAFGRVNRSVLQCFHRSLMNSSGVASDGRV